MLNRLINKDIHNTEVPYMGQLLNEFCKQIPSREFTCPICEHTFILDTINLLNTEKYVHECDNCKMSLCYNTSEFEDSLDKSIRKVLTERGFNLVK